MPATQKAQPGIDWPSYWLVVLERAAAKGEYDKAADAQEQLRRLGIDATIRHIPAREVAHD